MPLSLSGTVPSWLKSVSYVTEENSGVRVIIFLKNSLFQNAVTTRPTFGARGLSQNGPDVAIGSGVAKSLTKALITFAAPKPPGCLLPDGQACRPCSGEAVPVQGWLRVLK